MLKPYSTIKLIEIDDTVYQMHDIRYAESFEQCELMCNEDYSEKVVGEITSIDPFDLSEELKVN